MGAPRGPDHAGTCGRRPYSKYSLVWNHAAITDRGRQGGRAGVSSNVHEILSMLDSLSRLPMARRYRHLSSAILLASAGLVSGQILRAQTPAVPQQTPPPSAISIVPLQTAPASGEPLTLEAAYARALTSNPLIAAARLKRAINLAGVEVAGERPNPDAHVEI